MKLLHTILFLLVAIAGHAQSITVLPTMSPEGGNHDDNVTVTCTFPTGCSKGVYWIDGGELNARTYTQPITIDYSCRLSVAGVNEKGRIITDVISHDFTINRVTPPYVACEPKEGVRKTNFYVTKIAWKNVTFVDMHLDAFKDGGARRNEPVVWLTNSVGATIASSDYNGIWQDGINQYKLYLYKNYDVATIGNYTLHVAKNIFELDGKMYDQELQLQYEIAENSRVAEFTPEEGEYKNKVEVSIKYPDTDAFFYKFYKINGGRAQSYSKPLDITETSTIEAFGMDEEFTEQTASAFATYTIVKEDVVQPLDNPVITREGNTISISGPEGAALKYWLNDDMNTAALYSQPFAVSRNGSVSCVAFDNKAQSNTVSLAITGFDEDRGEYGDMVFKTDDNFETVHIIGISPNGRFAAGYTGSDISSKGFIWDASVNKFQYQSTVFINQLYGIADDGTAYGWRARTVEIDEQSTDEDFIKGICKNGVWTEQPKDFVANGITGKGVLFGSYSGKPATYDFVTETITNYGFGDGLKGALTTYCEANGMFGGYVNKDGKQVPALWKAPEVYTLYSVCTETYDPKFVDISANGEWAIIGQDYKVNLQTGIIEKLISMSARTHNSRNPEVLTAIGNDGTIFGTYDGSLLTAESGVALVYTKDCRWRSLQDWLMDEKGFDNTRYSLRSVRGLSDDQSTIILHAKELIGGEEDIFTVGLAIRLNVKVKHLAPASVTAEVMSGMETVKIEWEAPITDAESVTGYSVKRDGVVVFTCEGDVTTFYDKDVEPNRLYTYTVSATYEDGVTSEDSYPCEATYISNKYAPVRNLTARLAGLNSVYLTWDAPVISLPKIQYFGEENESYAFGTGFYNAEFGIRIPSSDLAMYQGQQIRTFQFLPAGPQKSYTINLYKGGLMSGTYDPVPFYSQTIDPATLNYGTVNVVALDTPQELPNQDLYVAVYIESLGNDNMLGVSYEGFKSGYTDLCRIEGIFESMLPISKNSSSTTEIVLPIGIGVCAEAEENSSTISNFIVSDNGVARSTGGTKMKLENLADGAHEIAVVTEYKDGGKSVPVQTILQIQENDSAYVPVSSLAFDVNADKTVRISWETPRDDDRRDVHWGDLTPQTGWVQPEGIYTFQAVSVYPVTMVAPYADDYEITELFYCPLEDVKYALTLDDGYGVQFVRFKSDNLGIDEIQLPEPVLGEINYVKLPNPITVSPSINYQLSVDAYASEPGKAPLAYDSSNVWKSGMSNLIDYGDGLGDLSQFVMYDEHPNWLMGMVVRQKGSNPLPVSGYEVVLDGRKITEQPIIQNEVTTSSLADGLHSAKVNVIYANNKKLDGLYVDFEVSDDVVGLEGVEAAPANSEDVIYDIAGRRVIKDKMGRGIFIISGKKQIK